jgi:hypothetical protein
VIGLFESIFCCAGIPAASPSNIEDITIKIRLVFIFSLLKRVLERADAAYRDKQE